MKSIMQKFFQSTLKAVREANQRGVALIITLLVMMVLVLLALAIVLQSNTEHLMSINEQDSFQALARGEEVLNWGDQLMRNWAEAQTSTPTQLTPILTGQIGTVPNRSNFLGFRTLDTNVVSRASNAASGTRLDTSNETTTSGVITYQGQEYEMFRLGPFTGDTRTVVYARVDDNYDDGAMNTSDQDYRIRLTVHAFYPVHVNSSGVEQDSLEIRPQAIRTIVGRFWPGGSYAIRTDGDLELWGTAQLCGECGAAHANSDLKIARNAGDTPDICGEATGSGTFAFNGGTIVGDRGLAPKVYIPIVNPYNELYVPKQTYFNNTNTLRDSSPGPQYDLSCPAPSTSDPGSSKYFALVRNTSGPNRMAQVWKAYPDTSNSGKWFWRLIDEKYDPGNPPVGSNIGEALNAVLDNCGRVVSCNSTIGCTPDRYTTDGGTNWLTLPVGSGVSDQGDNEFYGWSPSGNYNTDSCSGDNISSSSLGAAPDHNDWWTNNFMYISGNTYPSILPALYSNSLATTQVSNRICPGTTCPGVPPLPGTDENSTVGDGNRDFTTGSVLRDLGWDSGGSRVYSPLYGAVIFIYGDVGLTGNLSNIVFNNGVCSSASPPTGVPCAAGAQQDVSNAEAVPSNTWRVSVIVYGHVNASGGVKYAPAFGSVDNYQFAVVGGRDIDLGGTSNSFSCNSTDCDGTPTGTTSDYSGIFVVHEQVRAHGNPGLNGFIIAEDRIDCDNFVSPSGGALDSQAFGSIQIHYDCDNPIDPWAIKGVAMREWEEIQR